MFASGPHGTDVPFSESMAVPVRLLPVTTAVIGSKTGELPHPGSGDARLIPGTRAPFAGRVTNDDPDGDGFMTCWKFSPREVL